MNRHSDASTEHPWISLETIPEVEGWMELNNQELAQIIGNKPSFGHGICFTLAHGGELYLHTNADGDALLDVTPEAAWVAPLLEACTHVPPPRGQIWILPQHALLPLILGLNPLIATSRLVLRHEYRSYK